MLVIINAEDRVSVNEYIEIYKRLKLKYPNKKAEIIMIRFICKKLKEIKIR